VSGEGSRGSGGIYIIGAPTFFLNRGPAVSKSGPDSLFPVFQSGYRTQHSTETALVHLYNDTVTTIDRGEIGALVLVDMSAAFDTIDHDIMFDVFQ